MRERTQSEHRRNHRGSGRDQSDRAARQRTRRRTLFGKEIMSTKLPTGPLGSLALRDVAQEASGRRAESDSHAPFIEPGVPTPRAGASVVAELFGQTFADRQPGAADDDRARELIVDLGP